MSEWGPWIEHEGGPCPIDPEQPAFVRYQDGVEVQIPDSRGRNIFWEHESRDRACHIIAYRVKSRGPSQEGALKGLLAHAISKHVEGHSTTYMLPNGAKLVIPVGFANKEKSE